MSIKNGGSSYFTRVPAVPYILLLKDAFYYIVPPNSFLGQR